MGDEEKEKKLSSHSADKNIVERKEGPIEPVKSEPLLKIEKETKEKEKAFDKDDIEKLRRELEEKEKLAKDHYDKLLRAKAEFENFTKRAEKEKISIVEFANEALIKDLLQVIDSFEEAMKVEVRDENAGAVKDGMEKIYRQLMSILEKNGLTSIQATGKNFDPFEHEAIVRVESEEPEDVVVEEFQRGYKLNSKVIRPVKVSVSKGKFEDEKIKEELAKEQKQDDEDDVVNEDMEKGEDMNG